MLEFPKYLCFGALKNAEISGYLPFGAPKHTGFSMMSGFLS